LLIQMQTKETAAPFHSTVKTTITKNKINISTIFINKNN
jgi:hypothetical protein